MVELTLYIMIIGFLAGCTDKPETSSNKSNRILLDTLHVNPAGVDSSQIADLIKSIESGNCAEGQHIDGVKSGLYTNFEILDKLVSDSFWLKMSESQNVIMRFYSYRALRDRNKTLALQVKQRLRKDSTVLCFESNDFKFTGPIAYFMSGDE